MGDAIVAALDATMSEAGSAGPPQLQPAGGALRAARLRRLLDPRRGGEVARRQLLAVPDRVLRQPVRLPDRHADADARPGRRQPAAAPSLVDRAADRLGGAVDDAGLLRLLGAADGADLRAHLRRAAAHHHPRHPDPRRDGRLAPPGRGRRRAGRRDRRAAARGTDLQRRPHRGAHRRGLLGDRRRRGAQDRPRGAAAPCCCSTR